MKQNNTVTIGAGFDLGYWFLGVGVSQGSRSFRRIAGAWIRNYCQGCLGVSTRASFRYSDRTDFHRWRNRLSEFLREGS